MYYLKRNETRELLEIIHLEAEFDQTLPYFADLGSKLEDGTLLQLVESLQIIQDPDTGDNEYLLWEPETAMWCYVDSYELRVCRALGQPITVAALRKSFPEVEPALLTTFLNHLYRRALLKVNDEPGIDPNIYKNGPLFDKGYLVELYMTEKCNLGCKYCFAEAAPDNSTMPVEIGYLALDKAFALPAKTFVIEFAGGETYVEFDTFKRLVEYIELKRKQTGKQPYIAVQSNGTMFNKPHIRQFMIKHKINPAVSIDGPPDVQNAVRPMAGGRESAEAVQNGVRALQRSGFTQVPALVTVSRANVGKPEEIVDYFVSQDIHHVMYKEVLWLGRAEDGWNDLGVKPEEFFDFVKRSLEYTSSNNIFMKDLTTKRLMSNLLLRTRDTRCMRSPCNAGFDYFVIRPNGDVYPCADHVRPELKMGNIKDPEPLQLYFKKQPVVVEMKCHRSVKNIPGCRECEWRHLCEAECGLGALKSFGSLYHASPKCQFYKQVYPYLLKFARTHSEVISDYVDDTESVNFSLANSHNGPLPAEGSLKSRGAGTTLTNLLQRFRLRKRRRTDRGKGKEEVGFIAKEV